MAGKVYTDEEILAYKDKDPTPVQQRYADWLIEKLEIEFPSTKAQAAFCEAVRLATALRMIFQASPENQEARAEARAERAEAGEGKKGKKGKKGKATEETDDEATDEATDEADETPAAPKAKPAKAPAKKTGKAAKAAPVDDEDEGDEQVVTPPKKSAPRKASARSGASAPF